MPAYQTFLSALNAEFAHDKIETTAKRRDAFAPGASLADALPVSPLQRVFKSYLATVPPVFLETVRGVLHQALSTTPPTPVTLAWAPGYDFEITIWQAPDTKETPGGITVLCKSRYPADPHPLSS